MTVLNSGVYAMGAIALVIAACGNVVTVFEGRSPSPIQPKLDPELLHRLEGLSSSGHMNERLSVLIRTSSEINSDQEDLLKSRGVTINSKLSVILSAIIPAQSIQDVAALQFVLRIELARKLKER